MKTSKIRDFKVLKTLSLIIATFFVAAGLFMSNTLTARAADTPIEEVMIKVWLPVEGNSNNHEGIIIKGECEFDTSTNLFNDTNWCGVGYHDINSKYLKKDEKFEMGHDYGIFVALYAKSGYVFNDDTVVYINGTKAEVSKGSYGETTKATAYLPGSEIDCYKALKKINFEIEEPTVGKSVASKIKVTTEPEGVFSDEVLKTIDISSKWKKTDRSGNTTDVSWYENYHIGYTYSLYVGDIYGGLQLSTSPFVDENGKEHKYYYSEDYQFTVNGEVYGVYKLEDNLLDKDTFKSQYFYEILDKASVTRLYSPVDGEKPSYSVSGVASKYGVYNNYGAGYKNGVKWEDLTDSKILDENSVFVEGHKYKATVVLKTETGYYFNEDTVFTNYGKPCTDVSLYDKTAYGYQVVYYSIEYICKAQNPITEINFLIDKPIIGETPAKTLKFETVPKNAYSSSVVESIEKIIISSYWKYKAEDGTWKTMESDAVFEEGKTYGFAPGALVVVLFLDSASETNLDDSVTGMADSVCIKVNGNKHLDESASTVITNILTVYEFGKAEPKPTPTPTPTPTPGPTTPAVSPDGIAAEGTELAALEEVVVATENDKDLAGSSYNKIQAKASKAAKKTITLKWNEVEDAEGYIIYGNKCAKGNKYEKITELPAETLKFTHKKLKKGTYYKYLVVAYKTVDGKQVVVTTSKTIHAATTGGKVGNAKSIKVTKPSNKKKTLKVGKKFTLKAKQVPKSTTLKIKNHRKLSYESSDPAIATVSSKGKIKAVSAGTCYIYVYAQNGVSTKVKIKVKE